MNKSKPQVIKLKGSRKYLRLLAGEPQTSGMRSGYVQLKPGEEIGEHSTENKEEALIILSGKAKISASGSKSFIAKSPSLAYIPTRTKHNVLNIGKQKLSYVYIVVLSRC